MSIAHRQLCMIAKPRYCGIVWMESPKIYFVYFFYRRQYIFPSIPEGCERKNKERIERATFALRRKSEFRRRCFVLSRFTNFSSDRGSGECSSTASLQYISAYSYFSCGQRAWWELATIDRFWVFAGCGFYICTNLNFLTPNRVYFSACTSKLVLR